jgi:hypothetical protein
MKRRTSDRQPICVRCGGYNARIPQSYCHACHRNYVKEDRRKKSADKPLQGGSIVYVVGESGTRDVSKVGVANAMAIRMKNLQVGNWRELTVIKTWDVSRRPKALDVEKAVLAKFGSRRLSGEWMEASPSSVCEFIDALLVDGVSREARCDALPHEMDAR